MTVVASSNQKQDLHAANDESARLPADRLIMLKGSDIFVAKLAEDGSVAGYKKVKLARMYLPATPLSPAPTPISTRPELVSTLVFAARAYAHRVRPGKSFPVVASRLIRVAAKAIEYGWLHGLYALSDWTPALASKLADDLADGGWAGALRIRQRAKAFAQSITPKRSSDFLRNRDERRGYALKEAFCAAIGTCATKGELHVAKQELADRAGIVLGANVFDAQQRVRARSSMQGMSVDHLEQEFWCLNILSDLPNSVGLKFAPIPDVVRRARGLGRNNGRTENIGPEQVAQILVEAQRWQTQLADPIMHLWSEIESMLLEKKPDSTAALRRCTTAVMEHSKNRKVVENLIGVRVRGAISISFEHGAVSLGLVTYTLMTSCFVTIAMFNARRKDEVQHHEYGLHRGDLSVIDVKLSLYECWFYVEKTHRARLPFYVNDYTRRAVELLERISDLARRLLCITNEPSFSPPDSLFLVPRAGLRQSAMSPLWFSFGTSLMGQSRWFFSLALKGEELRLKAHMFRRAYALLFHYRYENATLLALAQQFGHFDLDMIHVYLTDVRKGTAATGADMYAKARHAQEAHQDFSQEVLEAVHAVAVERVEIFVREVLDGIATFSGGFARLVQRFHQKLGLRVEYRELDKGAKSDLVARLMINRGHEFRPFSHGNCVAPADRRAPLAHCSSAEDQKPRRAHASSLTCARCPYHVVSAAHVAALEDELKAMTTSLQLEPSNSLQALRAHADVANLERIIGLHRRKLQLVEAK